MPVYVYKCDVCGNVIERIEKASFMNSKKIKWFPCKEKGCTGGVMKRQIATGTGFIFKGQMRKY